MIIPSETPIYVDHLKYDVVKVFERARTVLIDDYMLMYCSEDHLADIEGVSVVAHFKHVDSREYIRIKLNCTIEGLK